MIISQDTILYYRGEPLRVKIVERKSATYGRLKKAGSEFIIVGPKLMQPQLKQLLMEWYKRNARVRLELRCRYFAQQLEVQFQAIHVKDQRSRWGSCSTKKNLNFNWRLIQAPDSVLDYVVIHELCHLKEMNHSKRFWAWVSSIMPNYKEQEAWLKEHGEAMMELRD